MLDPGNRYQSRWSYQRQVNHDTYTLTLTLTLKFYRKRLLTNTLPGITMPSPIAQAALIRDTYSRAGLDISKSSDRPQYFEAHGTGTALLPCR